MGKYRGKTEKQLAAEASKRQLNVVSSVEGEEPSKEDYIAILEANDVAAATEKKKLADEAKAAKAAGKNLVTVRALSRGEHPAGKIREAGEEFDYSVRDGHKLPSWVEDVEGKVESRVAGQSDAVEEEE